MTETEEKQRKLIMTFDPNTIEHLGIKMYSYIPNALAELIANSYDARATKVEIYLERGEDGRIIIKDNGEGMNIDDINQKFLRIGRNKRIEEGRRSSDEKRVVTGKKGLGKLALFGIGNTIEISTIKNSKKTIFKLDWNDLKQTKGHDYYPKLIDEMESIEDHGTTIILYNLKRKSDFDIGSLSISLSKLFNLFSENFRVFLIKDDLKIEVNNQLKYSQVESEFEFIFPEYSKNIPLEYEYKTEIRGKIITSEKPLGPNFKGITLFANGRMVNTAEFFGRSESSHFYSYVTGWLDVDFLDNLEEDVISTNRLSLDWNLEITEKLKIFLQRILSEIHKDWREKRNEKRVNEVKEKSKIDLPDWYQKLPDDIRENIKPIIKTLFEDSELLNEKQVKIVQNLHAIIPEYPRYHWRHLHPIIKEIAKEDYVNERYFDSTEKASRLYIQKVKDKSEKDTEKMDFLFNPVTGILMVTNCGDETEKNIQTGHQHLSQGVVSGCRNPLTHNPEYQKKLVDTGLFIEKDCLDMLSIISHLFRRLDESKLREQENNNSN